MKKFIFFPLLALLLGGCTEYDTPKTYTDTFVPRDIVETKKETKTSNSNLEKI